MQSKVLLLDQQLKEFQQAKRNTEEEKQAVALESL
jgi:hypothetical protein